MEAPRSNEQAIQRRKLRIVSVALAAASLAALWLLGPPVAVAFRFVQLADHHLPWAGMFFLGVSVVATLPFARRLPDDAAYAFRQRALTVALVMTGGSILTYGLLGYLPYSLAHVVDQVSSWKEMAENYRRADLPAALFPGPLAYQSESKAASRLLMSLWEGESIPWGAWAKPLLAWGSFFAAFWLAVVAMAAIVVPQWRRTERLPFPLVQLQRRLMGAPGESGAGPSLFRTKGFWIAVGVVFFIHFLAGFHRYFPGRFPVIRTTWNLHNLFRDEPLAFIASYMRTFDIRFCILALAFFMPARISFSIFFFNIAYAIYAMLAQVYTPPFNTDAIADQHTGAFVVYAAAILWVGRAHWFRAFRVGIQLPPRWLAAADIPEEDLRDGTAAAGLTVGLLAMVGWLAWAGVEIYWGVLLAVLALGYSLVIMRIIAETGLPFFGLTSHQMQAVFWLIPAQWLSYTTTWFVGALAALTGTTTRASTAVAAAQSLALDAPESTPSQQRRRTGLLWLLLIIGFVVAGGAHLWTGYTFGRSQDPGAVQPLGMTTAFGEAEQLLTQRHQGEWDTPAYSRPGNMLFGALLTGGLQWACMMFPAWPLHPLGVLLAHTDFSAKLWGSVLVGWLCRVLIVYVGGARLYDRAYGVFVGLLVGEFAAAAFWALIGVILWATGNTYYVIYPLP